MNMRTAKREMKIGRTARRLMMGGLLALAATAGGPLTHHVHGATQVTLAGVMTAGALNPLTAGAVAFRDDGSNREFYAAALNTTLTPGTRMDLFVDGAKVGSGPVLSKGEFSNGTFFGASTLIPIRDVPSLHAGSTVQWKGADGTVLMSGTVASTPLPLDIPFSDR